MRHTSGMHSSRRYSFLLLVFLIIFSIFISVRVAHGQSSAPSSPVHGQDATKPAMPLEWVNRVGTLAGQIAEAVRPSKAISLEVRNISSLGAADVAMIRRGLQQELSRRGIPIEADGLDVKVTLSENIERFVWIAEVRRKDKATVFIASLEGKATANLPAVRHSVVLQREVVWQQAEPMMDFLVADVAPEGLPVMFVLEARRIVSYRKEKALWNVAQTFPIPVPDHRPRDLRGLADAFEELFFFQLSDANCEGAAADRFELTCKKGSPPAWPILSGGQDRGSMNIVSNRNYFDGDLDVYGDVETHEPPFYSIAVMRRMKGSQWILAELDGKSRKYDESLKATAAYSGWGDEIVAVAPGCGSDWQILASAAGDWTEPDRLRSYDVEKDAAVADSEPLEFSGPILALWPVLDARTVRVVSRNLQTGMYEASVITVSCSQ
jgi:hypothetical protein